MMLVTYIVLKIIVNRFILGALPICPTCGKIVLGEKPIKINGEKENREPLKITPPNSVERR